MNFKKRDLISNDSESVTSYLCPLHVKTCQLNKIKNVLDLPGNLMKKNAEKCDARKFLCLVG